MLILVDDSSRFTMTRAKRHTSEAAAALMEMVPAFERSQVENLWGGEFNSKEIRAWLSKRGTNLKPTVPNQSETKAVAERANRTSMTTNPADLPR